MPYKIDGNFDFRDLDIIDRIVEEAARELGWRPPEFVLRDWRCNELLYSWRGGFWRWTSWAHPLKHVFYEIKDNELWEWL
jgi:hypothetical protein